MAIESLDGRCPSGHVRYYHLSNAKHVTSGIAQYQSAKRKSVHFLFNNTYALNIMDALTLRGTLEGMYLDGWMTGWDG
jgi:hypothetical protein